jgi:LysM repeat protein
MFGEDQYVVYDVKSGDTLAKIAKLYGVSVADIAKANMIGNVNKIETGMQLMIPEVYTGNATTPVTNLLPKLLDAGIARVTKIQTVKTPVKTTSYGMLSAQPSGILSGTLFGIPKMYAYGGIAVLTAGLALLILTSKKKAPTYTPAT